MSAINFIKAAVACACVYFLVSCAATPANVSRKQIFSPKVYTINAPAAGNYPQGLYKYPYRERYVTHQWQLFTQTLKWSPAAAKTFAANTQYTATLTLEPAGKDYTFKGTELGDVSGLPQDGVENITVEVEGENLVIKIVFEKTAAQNAAPKIIFEDNFEGNSLDYTKWEPCPEWDRQGRSSWRDDMISVSGGYLRIKYKRDVELGREKAPTNKALADNWIRSGAVGTMRKDNQNIKWDNTFGWYESRFKIPKQSGAWGGFWLMSPTLHIETGRSEMGAEIDILETINSQHGKYNGALHWNGYGDNGIGLFHDTYQPVDIYDGEFHTFALDWSPSEYVFYVDGVEFWRVDGGARFKNGGINQNPNYLMLSMEGAEYLGLLPEGFTEDEMLVDYVRVYNQPKIVK
ncbi:MAG: glycoside hydrolase family 16 protein [Treponema sp.]|jgi:beta-glucanase (GH16 family)|nr:glycoside hydrolase family 16 protein [Treponema sp.]